MTVKRDRTYSFARIAILLLICVVFLMCAQEALAQTCIEKAGLALKGEYLLLFDNPDGVGDYIGNTLFFPFGVFISALVVAIMPLNVVLMPGDCFKNPGLKDIDTQNFKTLQNVERNMSSTGSAFSSPASNGGGSYGSYGGTSSYGSTDTYGGTSSYGGGSSVGSGSYGGGYEAGSSGYGRTGGACDDPLKRQDPTCICQDPIQAQQNSLCNQRSTTPAGPSCARPPCRVQ